MIPKIEYTLIEICGINCSENDQSLPQINRIIRMGPMNRPWQRRQQLQQLVFRLDENSMEIMLLTWEAAKISNIYSMSHGSIRSQVRIIYCLGFGWAISPLEPPIHWTWNSNSINFGIFSLFKRLSNIIQITCKLKAPVSTSQHEPHSLLHWLLNLFAIRLSQFFPWLRYHN